MSETMAAIIKTAPKPGCMEYVTDFPKPEIKEDEILVQVKACGICGTDHSLYGWNEAIAKNYNFQALWLRSGLQPQRTLRSATGWW